MVINWTEVIIAVCSLIITSIIAPVVVKTYKTKVSKDDQETIEYWTEIAVRWAKQWLQTSEGQEKKQAVLEYVWKKLDDLGMDVDIEDLDKVIEAIYEKVKKESENYQAKTAPGTVAIPASSLTE